MIIADINEFRRWVMHARYGQSFVYIEGITTENVGDCASIIAMATEVAQAGLIMLFQRRVCFGVYNCVAIRTSAATSAWAARVSRSVASPPGNPAYSEDLT